MDKYGVKSTYDALRNKLLNYINTVYLGKNDALREACEEELQKIYGLATEEQREQMLRWYREHRNPQWPGGVEIIDAIFQLLICEC